MDTYASILLWAIPIFMIMMAVEILYGHYKKHQTYTFMDTISSLSSGMTNILKDSLGLVLVIISYPYIMEKISIMEIEASYLLYVVAFVYHGWDSCTLNGVHFCKRKSQCPLGVDLSFIPSPCFRGVSVSRGHILRGVTSVGSKRQNNLLPGGDSGR